MINNLYLELKTCDPSIYTMDHPKFIVSTRRKNPLVHKGLICLPFFKGTSQRLKMKATDSDSNSILYESTI